MSTSYKMTVECADIELRRQKKERCKRLYAELKRDLTDLDSVDFRAHWYHRAACLKEAGCWWHYNVITRKAREYLAEQGDYWGYSSLLRQVKKNKHSTPLKIVCSSCLDDDDESGRDNDVI